MLRSLLSIVGCLAAAGGIRYGVLEGARADATRRLDASVPSPGPPVASAVALNHRFAIADLLWLQCVQLIAKVNSSDRPPSTRIVDSALLATDFDPRYMTVYYAAGTVLSAYYHDPDASDRVVLSGHDRVPEDWRMPFIVGYNAYFGRRDAASAARWWAKTARMDGAPRFVTSLAGRAALHGSGPESAKSILEALIEHLPPGPQRQDALDRLAMVEREELLQAYDNACGRFFRDRGRIPDRAEDLVSAGYLRAPLKDAFGHPIMFEIYDEEGPRSGQCVARTDAQLKREFEAKRELMDQSPMNREKP
jgi:hypothetical protein